MNIYYAHRSQYTNTFPPGSPYSRQINHKSKDLKVEKHPPCPWLYGVGKHVEFYKHNVYKHTGSDLVKK